MRLSRKERQRIDNEVTDWMARLGGESVEARDEAFQAWLGEHPERLESYHAHCDVRRRSGVTSLPLPSLHPADDRIPPPRRRTAFLPMAIAAVLALAIGGFWYLAPRSAESTQEGAILAATSGLRLISFDSSRVLLLDRGGQARQVVDGQTNSIRLLSGRARLASYDAPFQVAAGDLRLTAHAVTFDIDMRGDQVTVTVLNGRLSVESHARARPLLLIAGQRLVTRGTEEQVMGATRDENDWSATLLPLSGRTLGDIVTIVARQEGPKLVLDNPDLATLSLQGQLRTTDIGAMARQLAAALELDVRSEAGNFIIYRKN
jgi:transmembrane sensor